MVQFDFSPEQLELKQNTNKRSIAQLSIFRIFSFFALSATLILTLSENFWWALPCLVCLSLFVCLINRFNQLKDQKRIYLSLQQLQSQKQARQERKLGELGAGTEFADKEHPFSGDLDLFGPHSLFQLLNHCTSAGGKLQLASLLKSAVDPKAAQQRREGAAELQQKPDFLRAMEAIGLAFPQGKLGPWKHWLEQQETQPNLLHLVLAILGPIGGVLVLLLTSQGIFPQAFLGLWFMLGVLLLALVFVPLKRAAEAIPVASYLNSLRLRAAQIEDNSFQSDLLNAEQSRLHAGSSPASKQLQELDRLGLWTQNRLNLLYLPINLLFWTDFILFLWLATWKKRVGNSLAQLPETLENWEVWVSLGSFEVEVGHPGISAWSQEPILEAENVFHPLLLPAKAVANSLILNKDRKLVLLTGSNMSGKTTFMRTLGINAVLLNLGLRPFADSMTLGPLQIFTSMRNTDNLGESISSFYAELSRIRTLLQRLEQGELVFFLLDEILKGTNTQDRISGSEALVAQLLPSQGLGLISTHDIELAALGSREARVQNYSFHSEIQDQEILFDYRLKEGACPSFNAHKLMELMGIKFVPK
ncbi:MAG: DNA mismatch repair protein [Bacteroidetes bacterium]|nr:DNA mismatch repair protein [Bacteroidota bacterium]